MSFPPVLYTELVIVGAGGVVDAVAPWSSVWIWAGVLIAGVIGLAAHYFFSPRQSPMVPRSKVRHSKRPVRVVIDWYVLLLIVSLVGLLAIILTKIVVGDAS